MLERLEALHRIRSPGWIAFAGLVALAVAMGIGRFAFTPILPMMQEDVGVSIAEGGWLASANYAGYLFGALSVMRLRGLGTVTAIRGGLVAIGILTLAVGFESQFVVWIVLRFLAGVASAWVMILVSAWCLERLASLGRPLLTGTVFAGVGTGIAAAGGVCIVIAHSHGSSAQAWITLGVLSLVLSAVVWPSFSEDAGSRSETAKLPTTGSAHWDAESIRLVLCYGAFGFGYIIPATFLPVMAKQVIHNPGLFGWSWPIFGLAAVASTLVVAALSRNAGNRSLWIISHLVMALGVVFPVVLPGLGAIVVAALFIGGTVIVVAMLAMQEARNVAGHDAPRLMAAMTSAFAIGQMVGPIAVSYTVGVDGDFSGALLGACFLLLASACVLALGRKP